MSVLGATAFGGQKPSKQRVDAIWEAVDDRVTRQIDVWFDDGDFPKAIQTLSFEANYAPHDYEAVTNLGWMFENVEDWDRAMATYRTYLKNNPQDVDAALPIGQYYYNKKDYAKVPPILESTLSRHPHPNVYRILAHCYEKLNKLNDAKRVWLAYIALHPTDLTAKVNLKRIERKLGAS